MKEMLNEVITVGQIKTESVEIATQESERTLALAQDFAVVDQGSYEYVCNVRKESKKRIKKLEAERKEATGPLDVAKQTVMGWFRKPIDIYRKIIDICDHGMLGWDAKQEAIRKAQQEKLNHQAETERKKKEEQERAWREKEEAKRREAEALEAEGKQEEAAKARAEADKAEAKAEERQEAANGVIAPVIGPAVGKVEGTSYRTDWYGEVTDIKALMRAVLEGKAPSNLVIADDSAVNKTARASKGTLNIDGIRFYSKKILVSKG